jgi:hypothetical protein
LKSVLWYLQRCLFCPVLPWLFVVFCVSKWTCRLGHGEWSSDVLLNFVCHYLIEYFCINVN